MKNVFDMVKDFEQLVKAHKTDLFNKVARFEKLAQLAVVMTDDIKGQLEVTMKNLKFITNSQQLINTLADFIDTKSADKRLLVSSLIDAFGKLQTAGRDASQLQQVKNLISMISPQAADPIIEPSSVQPDASPVSKPAAQTSLAGIPKETQHQLNELFFPGSSPLKIKEDGLVGPQTKSVLKAFFDKYQRRATVNNIKDVYEQTSLINESPIQSL